MCVEAAGKQRKLELVERIEGTASATDAEPTSFGCILKFLQLKQRIDPADRARRRGSSRCPRGLLAADRERPRAGTPRRPSVGNGGGAVGSVDAHGVAFELDRRIPRASLARKG